MRRVIVHSFVHFLRGSVTSIITQFNEVDLGANKAGYTGQDGAPDGMTDGQSLAHRCVGAPEYSSSYYDFIHKSLNI